VRVVTGREREILRITGLYIEQEPVPEQRSRLCAGDLGERIQIPRHLTTKVVTSLLDPSPAPLRKAPRDAGSWATAAAGSRIVAIDNISTFPTGSATRVPRGHRGW